MSEKRFYLGNNDTTICDRSQGGSDGFNMLTIFKVVGLLNEQQATIEMYQRRVDKREEQISIIKKYCLKFLTDEQFETIRKELENG